MKSKKFFLIYTAVLAIHILLISLSVILLPGSSCYFGRSSGFHPVKIEVPSYPFVGQLRFFKDGKELRSGLWGGETAELKFCGKERAASAEGKEVSQVPGTSVAQYRVPPGIIEEPGNYGIGTKEKGYCKFEVE